MEEEEVKDGADDPMQLTTCLLRCHLSCNCRRENVVIIVVVVVDGTDDRRRPRQGSTLFEKPKHRNTAARSQVPAECHQRLATSPTTTADSFREKPKAGLQRVCHYELPHSTGRKDLSRLPLVLRRHRSIITQRHRDVETILQNTNHPKISRNGMYNIH